VSTTHAYSEVGRCRQARVAEHVPQASRVAQAQLAQRGVSREFSLCAMHCRMKAVR